jgi:parallel beta-helix repeat protein
LIKPFYVLEEIRMEGDRGINVKVVVLAIALLASSLICGARFFEAPQTSLGSHTYPLDFDNQTLQQAIWNDTVKEGETLFVQTGTFPANLNVNKSLTLWGWSKYATILDGGGVGSVMIVSASNVKITGFTIRGGAGYGICVNSTGNCEISGNIVTGNVYGVTLWYSTNCTLSGNDIKNSYGYNFGIYGNAHSHYIHSMDASNTADGKPVCYWRDRHDEPIPSDAGYVAIIDSTNISVRNLVLNRTQGLLVAYSSEVTVENIQFVASYYGVEYGVDFLSTTNSVVQNITAQISNYGIILNNSTGNTVRYNSLFGRVSVSGGIQLQGSNCNLIADNMIKNCTAGIYLSQCLNNTLVGNTLTMNYHGMDLDIGANGSIVFHNNFIDNKFPAYSALSPNSRFDNGYEGNYWHTNYTGNDTDGDGIGETPYEFDVDQQDNCPLVDKWKEERAFRPDMDYYVEANTTVTLSTCSNSTLASLRLDRESSRISLSATCGYSGFLNITIPRRWLDGPFQVKVDGNAFTLDNDNCSAILDYTLIHIDYSKGTHTIEIIGTQLGTIRGDLNGDGKVDLFDAVILLVNYGRTAPTEEYKLNELNN